MQHQEITPLSQLIQVYGAEKGQGLYQLGLQVPLEERFNWWDSWIDAKLSNSVEPLKTWHIYKSKPVDIETFIKSPYYLDKSTDIYPKLLEELIEINSGRYVEVVWTGGIGSGKTTGALYTIAYQLYLISMMKDPHASFGMDKASEILFIFQSINASLAKAVSYNRFKAMIDDSPYFKEHFPYDKDLSSKLVFPNRVEVVPVSGLETAAIGQNVISGVIDELNYMNVIEKSKSRLDFM